MWHLIAFLAYLLYQDVNVIVVGWGILASDAYPVAAKNTRLVGEYLGQFLEFLNRDSNLEYKDVHISGHSLGSYVAGFAGAYHEGRIGRITGRTEWSRIIILTLKQLCNSMKVLYIAIF